MREPDHKQLSETMKLLAHPERLRILDVLRREPECVCHLEALLGKPQPYVSQQLRLLREAGLIADEKDGVNVFYRLVDAEVAGWLDMILGSVLCEDPDMALHKKVIACTCPKCEPASQRVAILLD
jgi:DNA-binding transcriptional ArsR family regulator